MEICEDKQQLMEMCEDKQQLMEMCEDKQQLMEMCEDKQQLMEMWEDKQQLTFDETTVNGDPSCLWIHRFSVHCHDIETQAGETTAVLKDLV